MTPVNEFCLDNYDAIGFDFDHTICKYKLPLLFDLIYDSLAKYLVHNCNYPSTILEKHSLEQHWVQKGIILDKARGNFLKLDKNLRIVKAYHGTKEMSQDSIIRVYGSDCVWEESKNMPGKICSKTYFEQPFYVFKDYFTTIGAVLCAKIVDSLDQQNNGPLPSYEFFKHYLSALYYIYDRGNFRKNTGFFFPALKENPHLYIETCSSELKQWLRDIRKSKKLFILTSAHSDIVKFLAKICIGDDWRDYFDVVITYAKKPSFFTGSCPFYLLEDDHETDVISVQQMKPFEMYSQGNWSDLSVYLGLCSSGSPKAIYVGDSIIEDIFAPSQFLGLDTVAIVEEIAAEDNISKCAKHKNILQSDTWGSFFCIQNNREIEQSLWASIIASHSKIAISSLGIMSTIKLDEKIPAFSAGLPNAGYFPSIPASCKTSVIF